MNRLIEINNPDTVTRSYLLLMQVAGAISTYTDSKLFHDVKVSLAHYAALKALMDNNGKMTHSELAAWTNTRQHNITTLVRRMQSNGLVSTDRSETDKRVIFIMITPKGKDLYENWLNRINRRTEQSSVV